MPSNLTLHFPGHFGKNLLSNDNSCMLLNHEIRKITYRIALKDVMEYHSDIVTILVYILY
jgi:hypothetical protein